MRMTYVLLGVSLGILACKRVESEVASAIVHWALLIGLAYTIWIGTEEE